MALDIPEPQVLVYYADDPNVSYHHRVLLRRVREATWAMMSPDEEIEVADLTHLTLYPLARGGAVPAFAEGDAYLCDAAVIPRLPEHHASAARLAAILMPDVAAGPAAGGQPDAQWRVADTSAADFSEVIPDDVVHNVGTGVVRGAVALVMWGRPARWVFAEQVPNDEVTAWTTDKQSGAGRDPRLGGGADIDPIDGTISLAEARRGFRPRELEEVAHWPHRGPRAVVEVVSSVHALGLTFFTYHEHWVRVSGAVSDSGVSHEHRSLCQILGLSMVYDRLDPTNCAALELCARRLIMIERAVRVNPRAPSFEGLAKMTQHSLDEGGGLATRDFTAHMAQVAEAEARVLKQNRLLREEMALKTRGGGHKDGKGKEKGKDEPK